MPRPDLMCVNSFPKEERQKSSSLKFHSHSQSVSLFCTISIWWCQPVATRKKDSEDGFLCFFLSCTKKNGKLFSAPYSSSASVNLLSHDNDGGVEGHLPSNHCDLAEAAQCFVAIRFCFLGCSIRIPPSIHSILYGRPNRKLEVGNAQKSRLRLRGRKSVARSPLLSSALAEDTPLPHGGWLTFISGSCIHLTSLFLSQCIFWNSKWRRKSYPIAPLSDTKAYRELFQFQSL